ncbi:DegT/DnrJ/EryC1/StrS family aminotransferase [Mangrovivirga sp. M17]|uniref:DegT/DnrJ/EryC1/StrS family aminotransferase n=1 Tax=Mangrovivirga halotolerans TaxID=2993936 RepID=A0ABT3RNJ8_9BACT|nr:DegT/DnrJ/EryC1/StrS family aminotransferase [Mangrovivirga halotolerans]MCX2743390.1 DegT/DnrJ/EryC1/StrS family aminotransferase [Mangrovivirga halotolerans]
MSMRVDMVDLKRQHASLRNDIHTALDDIMDESMFIQGSFVNKFEENISKFQGVEHCIGCGSGTGALILALKALKVRRGDQVIIPANGHVSAVEAVLLCGGRPVFADVDPETFSLTRESILPLINKKTVGIITVHLYGQAIPLNDLADLKDEHKLWILEDAAQAIGSKWEDPDTGKAIPAGGYGEVSAFSFYPTKNLGALGDSGACMTNDEKLARQIRMIGDHGQIEKDFHVLPGTNSRLDNLQAAILDIKLKHLNDLIEIRRSNARRYFVELNPNGNFSLPFEHPQSYHTFHQFVLTFKNQKRDEFREYLKSKGVQTQIHYPVALNNQPAFRRYVKKENDLTNSNWLVNNIVSIPIHSELSQEEVNYVIETINTFCR